MEVIRQETNVILVEPSGPLNIGSVARLCENFGVKELRLVAPRCDPNDDEARKMAVKGKRFLEKAKTYSYLLDAIADCRRIIATAGRIEHGEIPLCDPDEAINWLLETSNLSPIALVFGREDRGLTNQELLLAHKVITLNKSADYPSLNLSHAVSIVLHELDKYKQQGSPSKKKQIAELASAKQVNSCLKDAEALFLEIGFLYEHTAQSRMSKIKALLQRAEVRPEEVSLIRGVLRQMRWAIDNQNS